MTNPERSVKTLAIRLDEGLHAQLTVLAQLAEMTVTDAIRQAIEAYVEVQRSQGNLAAKAAGALEEIEREATTRRSAIQALFGDSGPAEGDAPQAESPKSRGRKATDAPPELTS